MKFRCEVEVLEFIKHPDEINDAWPSSGRRRYHLSERNSSHPITVVVTCVGAFVITILLPWLMVGSSGVIE